VATIAALGPPSARAQGGDCLTADPPPIATPERPIRFGITPLAAGSAGVNQLEPKPEDTGAAIAALRRMRPPGKELVMRLNRMFWADGVAGIRRYARIVDRYARAGFRSELQVRYHPPAGAEGDIAAWRRYVRQATRILGRRPAVSALSITNEANFSVSPNTSDGSYEGVREAVVAGTIAADRELRRIGRRDIELGFSFAWRWLPGSDRSFWEEIGERATPEFRRALDYVGLQVYPGLVWPPAPLPGRSAGEEVAEALTLLRDCYLPIAGIGAETDVWVSENGYPTNLGRSEGYQRTALRSTLDAVVAYSGELGISDYRWFNLRDNNTHGPDLFDAVGLLRDDYSAKPALRTFAAGIARSGTEARGWRGCRGRPATLIGTPGPDLLRGTAGDDVILGRGGGDRIRGRGGDDLLCGGPGADRIHGGPGDDELRGQRGSRDRCRGGAGRDLIRGCER
jgi:hypothetical protein